MVMALALSPSFFKPHCSPSPTNPISTVTAIRPAVILPGLGNNTGDYQKLEVTLQEYGVPTVVAKVSRFDWLRNAAGLVDPNYWSGTLRPRPVLDWYLKRIDEAVQEAKELAQDFVLDWSLSRRMACTCLHGRIWAVRCLLVIDSWPPPKGVPGVIDQTRGLLDYVEKHCMKAVYTPELRYVCIAGRYIQGARFLGDSNVEAKTMVPVENDQPTAEAVLVNDMGNSTSTAPRFRARFVGQGYKQVCGQADVWGDGVVPEVSAHLDGALNISLDGVYHSPVGSDDDLRPWYGSPAVVEQWIHHLLN
ncbi:uncharacterized protein LOC7493864 isoform X2 [Populus trichocarpa]|uniref:uncharacterized protein LOC7493864 isoform X2 n=1 Tax=Populus trichocarpa TaxID=3694 RepID=UPI002277D458|nr:uncharacterized protein LOC7493864 isoform X2 [Populus trichocarpa]